MTDNNTSAAQPEALRLAVALDDGSFLLWAERGATAAELRRLHAENESLRAQAAEQTTPANYVQVPAATFQMVVTVLDWMPTSDGAHHLWRRQQPALQALQALQAAQAQAAERAVPAHIAAMERAWQWMENQADGQSKGGHATFDLMMLREERDALRAAIELEAAAKACPHCDGAGQVLGHAENCSDELCALNGDIHSCAGKVEPCQCVALAASPAQPAHAQPPAQTEHVDADVSKNGLEPHIAVPRDLIAAACSAIDKKRDAPKVLAELRRYTVGDLSDALRVASRAQAPAGAPGDELARDLKSAIDTSLELRQQLRLMEEHARGEVWRWQADGANDLATMGNRMGVLIYASDLRNLLAAATPTAQAAPAALRPYVSPVKNIADLVNNLLLMDQTLPVYGAQYIEHEGRRRAIAVDPTVSRERVKGERWIGEGDELNAAVIWTRAEQPVQAAPAAGAVAGPDLQPLHNLLYLAQRQTSLGAMQRVVGEARLELAKVREAAPTPADQADSGVQEDALDLLQDIDSHMRSEWSAGRLPASCWPLSICDRMRAALAAKGEKNGAD